MRVIGLVLLVGCGSSSQSSELFRELAGAIENVDEVAKQLRETKPRAELRSMKMTRPERRRIGPVSDPRGSQSHGGQSGKISARYVAARPVLAGPAAGAREGRASTDDGAGGGGQAGAGRREARGGADVHVGPRLGVPELRHDDAAGARALPLLDLRISRLLLFLTGGPCAIGEAG